MRANLLGFLDSEIFGSLTRLVDTTELYDAHVRGVMLGMGFDPTTSTRSAGNRHAS